MKKIIVCLFSMFLCLSLCAPVMAEQEDEFTPSVSGGKIPGIVTETVNGLEIVGFIMNHVTGEKLGTVYTQCLYVVSLEDAQKNSNGISEAHRNELIGLYNKFLNEEIKLGDNLVVRDLFLADLIHDDCKGWLQQPNTTLDITFEMNVAQGTDLKVATFINGEWTFVNKVVINADGTVTVTFDDLCPIVFLVPEEKEVVVPEGGANTGDSTNVALLLTMLVGSAYVMTRSRKAN